jgi:hypothetical protein
MRTVPFQTARLKTNHTKTAEDIAFDALLTSIKTNHRAIYKLMSCHIRTISTVKRSIFATDGVPYKNEQGDLPKPTAGFIMVALLQNCNLEIKQRQDRRTALSSEVKFPYFPIIR